MKLTTTEEDENNEIEFLDCIIRRNSDNSLSHRWSKKKYSSSSILNYHSYHPLHMKENVVREMIKRALQITSPEFIDDVKKLLITILENSSYPQPFIIDHMFVDIEPRDSYMKSSSTRYVSCPYLTPVTRQVKTAMNPMKPIATLAMRPTMKNRDVVYTNMKSRRNNGFLTNSIFKLNCEVCNFSKVIHTDRFDVRRKILSLFNDPNSSLNEHLKDFPGHSFTDPKILKTLNSSNEMKHISSALSFLRRKE